MRLVSWIIMLRTTLTLAQQTSEYRYWWLGLPSPFGGRNYNLEQVRLVWSRL